MKRILISQRLDAVPGRDEERDALDVRWAQLLFSLGFLPIPLCSALAGQPDYLAQLQPDAIVLSGGNDIGQAPARDRLETQLLDYAKAKQLPVLGVCRGMQMLNHYLGGSLVTVSGHVATRHSLEGDWAQQYGYQEVNSYHNQAITRATLAPDLEILATSTDGAIEAVQCPNLAWLGIMWHPERETEFQLADQQLLSQHLNR